MNPEAVEQAEIDYIVVGSGAGGGPLAGNLAKAGYRVLLFEAGGEDENFHYQVPCFHGLATEDECYAWDYFVRHYTDDNQQKADTKYVAKEDGIFYPRAGTLGGCTAHNAMITVYPHNEDWDAIAKLTGDSSWSSGNMRQYFERLEACGYINENNQYHNLPVSAFLRFLSWFGIPLNNPSRHGFGGWLSTELADVKLVLKDLELIEIILKAVKKAFLGDGTPLTNLRTRFDPNDWRAVKRNADGFVFTPLATRKGRRNGPREYICRIKEEFPDKLIVKTGALVTRVLLDENKKAVGVEYLEGRHLYKADPRADKSNGNPETLKHIARVKREVILSAGAFNTPQLLKLSGIGPREELERFGIPVRVELPGVGENLQDRYEVGVVSRMKRDFALLKEATFTAPLEGETGDPYFVEWLNDSKGVYTTNGVVAGIIKRSQPDKTLPDLYIFGVPGFFKGYYPGYSKELQHHKDIFTWAILKAHTNNTAGQVTLKSADPRETPSINFRYFDESNDFKGEDLDAVADGVEFVRSINELIDVDTEEMLPGDNIKTRAELKQFIKNEAWGHHASCSCKIGAADDPMAVLDKDFKVYGTENLRVVDASVFPRIPGFFIVTAIYMISEKASDVIIADAG
jgi:choline dehydrogenase